MVQVAGLALDRGPLAQDLTLLQYTTVLAFPFTLQQAKSGDP